MTTIATIAPTATKSDRISFHHAVVRTTILEHRAGFGASLPGSSIERASGLTNILFSSCLFAILLFEALELMLTALICDDKDSKSRRTASWGVAWFCYLERPLAGGRILRLKQANIALRVLLALLAHKLKPF